MAIGAVIDSGHGDGRCSLCTRPVSHGQFHSVAVMLERRRCSPHHGKIAAWSLHYLPREAFHW